MTEEIVVVVKMMFDKGDGEQQQHQEEQLSLAPPKMDESERVRGDCETARR